MRRPLYVLSAATLVLAFSAAPATASPPAACEGCVTTASGIKVVSSESTQFTMAHVQDVFDNRKQRLLKCFSNGWHPEREKQLDYLLGYSPHTGEITNLKGPMFGTGMNEKVLSCMSDALKGATIGKGKDPELKGFNVTLRIMK
jgi:hypothetical protein